MTAAGSALAGVMNPVLTATTERSWNGGKCLRTSERAGSLTDAPAWGVFRSERKSDQSQSMDMLVGKSRRQ